MKKIAFTVLALIATLCCAFGFVACAGNGDDNSTIMKVAVTNVTLNKSELTLEIGGEETLTATVKPDNATNKAVEWSVSPAGIVTVNNGKVTAVAAGNATVTATADGKSATCAVTVKPAAVKETFKGAIAATAKDSAEEAAAAFVAEEFAGELEFVSYEKTADLTAEEIAALDLGEYSASDVERGEKGTVTYSVGSDEMAHVAIEDNETVDIYIVVIGGKYYYYTLRASEGERITKSYFEYVFDINRYLNCTLTASLYDESLIGCYTEEGAYLHRSDWGTAYIEIVTEEQGKRYFSYRLRDEEWEYLGEEDESDIYEEYYIITALLSFTSDYFATENGFGSVLEESNSRYTSRKEFEVFVEDDIVKKVNYSAKRQGVNPEDGWDMEFSYSYELSDFGTTKLPSLPDELKELIENRGSDSDTPGQPSLPNPGVNLTEDTDFEALVSDKVSENEWKVAFSEAAFNNSTVKHVNDHYGHVGYRYSQVSGSDKYVYVNMEDEDENYITYYSIENGNKYGYAPNDDGALVREDGSTAGEVFDKWMMSFTFICPSFAPYYSEFTYDEKAGAYVYNGDALSASSPFEYWNLNYTNISIKIVGGRVACITCERVLIWNDGTNDGLYGDGLYEFYMYDYGTTKVTLPTEFITRTHPSLDELKEAIARSKDKNYTKVTVTADDSFETLVSGDEGWDEAIKAKITIDTIEAIELKDWESVILDETVLMMLKFSPGADCEVRIEKNDDVYTLTITVNEKGMEYTQEMYFTDDFYCFSVVTSLVLNDEEIRRVESSCEWGYVTD